MIFLGISGLHHSVPFKRAALTDLSEREYLIAQGANSAAALVVDDEIVAAAAEERFTRRKATGTFPINAVRFCLEKANVPLSAVDTIAHGFSYEHLKSHFDLRAFTRNQFDQIYSRAAQLETIKAFLPDVDLADRFVQVPHHLAHAASAFNLSGFRASLILVVDGIGEEYSTSIAVGSSAGIEIIDQSSNSLGILYGVFTLHLGFAFGMDEYKVMGLAPYGDPERYIDKMRDIIMLHQNGSYSIPILRRNRTLLEKETYRGTLRILEDLFGPAREPESEICQHHMDIAAALQVRLQECLVHVLDHFRQRTGQRNLCMAGGVALNCSANGVIWRRRMFDKFFVQPASGDDGSALGAALYARTLQRNGAPIATKPFPAWGPSFDSEHIQNVLETTEPHAFNVNAAQRDLASEVARRIADGQVVAWFQGAMEFGPRALGNRSILADPRDAGMRDRVNALIKKREGFRPFAPAVTAEAASRYFEIEPGDEHVYAHMLLVAPVRPEYRDAIPAVTHVDGSARVQVVFRDDNPEFWALIRELELQTGVPIVLNTSFNVRGQPVVCTPQEAIETFLSAGLDALAIGDYLITPSESARPAAETTIDDVGVPESESCVLTDEDYKLLGEWNNTITHYPRDQTVAALFEKWAVAAPKATALQIDDRSLCYEDLNTRANQLAHVLVDYGVGPETIVGICLERSFELIVGLLAILKAGGAYLPLDPEYPAARLIFMLEDAGAPILITKRNLDTCFSDFPGNTIHLDEIATDLSTRSSENPAVSATTEDLAYVMYTSGSTGRPKGTLINQLGIIRLIRKADYAHFGKNEIFLQYAPVTFDAATFEIWGALLNGSSLVLVSQRRPGIDELGRLIQRHKITTLWLTAGLFHLMVDTLPNVFSRLRQLLTGGEPLSPRHVAAFTKQHPNCRLINGYGPTENTTFTCCHTFTASDKLERGVPIGRPINNTQVYVLDENLRLAPIGSPGELCIAGDGLARGYLSRPQLTAERFVNVSGSQLGRTHDATVRIYRSGDRVRWLADGKLVFLGRFDDQVKIRGHRIEPQEVEAVLCEYPRVRHAVVVIANESPLPIADRTDSRLYAYIVWDQDKGREIANLRSFAGSRLPNYMMPSAFVSIDALPLTPNGKIDKQALPAPDLTQPDSETDFEMAHSPIEEMLCDMFCEFLGCDRVRIRDDFFDMGGHSLLAMSLVSRIRTVFGVELPLQFVFEAPTILEIARHIENRLSDGRTDDVTPIVPVEKDRNLPLSFAQLRLWILEQLGMAGNAYHIQLPFRLKGVLDRQALVRSLLEIVARHESLRTRFQDIDGNPVQEILPPTEFAVPLVDRIVTPSATRVDEINRILQDDNRCSFNLAVDPPFRFRLIMFAADDHLLMATFHHIAFDGLSAHVYTREMSTLYNAFSEGQHSPLPPLAIQYADFAVWQRQRLSSGFLEKQLTYWRDRLQDIPTLDLPTDYPRLESKSLRGKNCRIDIAAGLTAELQTLSRDSGATLYMTLLAVFMMQLSRYTGQERIAVGSPIANRRRSETDGLIGFFVNTLVMCADVDCGLTFRDLLRRVRESARGAFANMDLPFEKLVEALNPERRLDRNAIVQVLFNMVPPQHDLPGFHGVTATSVEPQEAPAAKFDLTLYLEHHESCLHLNLVYDGEIFSQRRMEALLRQYVSLTAQVIADPDRKIYSYSLLTPEFERQLPDFSKPQPVRDTRSIPEQISAVTRHNPNKIAVVDDIGELSYGALTRYSDRFAHHLLAAGLEIGDVVAVYATRDMTLVAVLLGIIKAGGAFAILDPAYPAARLAQYISIASVKGMIVLENAGQPPPDVTEELRVDGEGFSIIAPHPCQGNDGFLHRYPHSSPNIVVHRHSSAYVTYTSGSTGSPKGVQGDHGPLAHYLDWFSRKYDVRETDRFGALAGLSHDPMLRDVFAPLWSGATLFMSEACAEPNEALFQWGAARRLTICHMTPLLVRLLASMAGSNHSASGKWADLRHLFIGGDVFRRSDLERIRTLAPRAKVYNVYGTTETPQIMSLFETNPSDGHDSFTSNGTIPIGRGIDGVQLLILGRDGETCGLGEPGEIHIRSPYLARGYVNDPEHTKRAFVRNPRSSLTRDRMYRTGDIGRYLPDGKVEFLGRIDDQVKIRGVRVTPGEIVTVLSDHPDVQHAAVITDTSSDNELVLTAYVARRKTAAPCCRELRRHTAAQLPAHFIPSRIIIVDDIPMTPSRKIDRHRLAAAETREHSATRETVAVPLSPIEEMLVGIWMDVLQTDRIEIDDDFFELGGHSLTALAAISRIRKNVNQNLPMSMIFRYPTIRAQAQQIESVSMATQPQPAMYRHAEGEFEEGRL